MNISNNGVAALSGDRKASVSTAKMGNGMLIIAALALALAGCATPKGTLTYYLPKAQTILKVNQTLTCNAARDALVQVVTVSPATTYSADFTAPVTISPSAMDGLLSNADVAFNFTNDGRLSSVNVTTVGQGGDVVKGILAVAKVALVSNETIEPSYSAIEACKVIDSYMAKAGGEAKKDENKDQQIAAATDKSVKAAAKKEDAEADVAAATPKAAGTVTITYETTIDYKRAPGDQSPMVTIEGGDNRKIEPDANSALLFVKLSRHIPGLGFQAKVASASEYAAPTWSEKGDVNIKLNKVADAVVEVTGLAGDMRSVKPLATFWSGSVPVPLTSGKNDLFDVPVPTAAVFGTRKFLLTLTDYGSITKIQYSATNGVAEGAAATAALGSAWAAPRPQQTTAQLADAMKAEGDLIYQQQRKATCVANPEACTK